MKIMALRSVLALAGAFLLCYAPLRAETPPPFHERLTWGSTAGARFTLEYWARSEKRNAYRMPTDCVLHTRLTRSQGGRSQSWEGRETFKDPQWAQIDLAVAVRVEGQASPQILVRRSRSNWGDYLLYRMNEQGLKESFRFSYRDDACIRWIAPKGRLQRFVAINRYETRNRPEEPPGKRWQKRLVYRYDSSRQNWRPVSEGWETYVFNDEDSGLHNPVFNHPHNCPFRFAR